ncbi:MAG: chromosome segregation ATPase [Bermanella sp.]|jgi:chromosome segregation ATPase
MQEQLKNKLAQLKQTIGQIDSLDSESRELLEQLDRDIQAALANEKADDGINHRLEQQAVEFDSQHPNASAVMRDIIDMLGKMGI